MSAVSTSSVQQDMVLGEQDMFVPLRCSQCNETFKKPFTLSCLHTFCYGCVAKLENFEKGDPVRCPCCEQESCLHEGNIRANYFFANTLAASVLKNIQNDKVHCGNCITINYYNRPCVFCEECNELLCEKCMYCHQNTKMTRNHSLVSRDMYEKRLTSSGHERRVYCRVHDENIVDRYCTLCEEPTCCLCEFHSQHKMISLADAISFETPVLRQALEKATEKVDGHEKCASKCCQMVDELRACRAELSDRITSYFTAYKERLDRCQEDLLNTVLMWYNKKFELIKLTQKEEEGKINKISNAIKQSHVVLKHGTDLEILSLKNLIQSQLNHVATLTTGESLMNAIEEAIRSASWDSTRDTEQEFSVKGLWLPEVKPEQITNENDSESYSDDDYEKLFSDDKDVKKTTTDSDEGSRRSRKTSGVEGEDFHIGAVIVPGAKPSLWKRFRDVIINRAHHEPHEAGRDYRYDKILRNRTIGKPGTGHAEFHHPCDIAVDRLHHDRFVITDYNNDRVQVFNHFGDFLFTFGSRGSKLGQFIGPTGVAVLHNGSIVVSDSLNNRVQIFTSKGIYYNSFGEEGRSLGQLWRPMGVAVDSQSRIIVVDQGNNRLQIFDSNGDFCFAFGELGHWDGMVSCPNFVAIDNDDNIYVSDEVSMRIQIFDRDGNYVRKITADEVHGFHGNVDILSGIAVDSRGYVIVGGKNRCGVQVFTPDGRFLRRFTSKYTTQTRLQFSCGIALTSAGEIVVPDWRNNRIRFF